MKIALVGFTGSQMDIGIVAEVLELLPFKADHSMFDPVDLNMTQRDFLAEVKEYDMVVLMYIYLPKIENSNEDYFEVGSDDLRVSVLQSKENWRKRLLATKAKRIFLFGHTMGSEVTGEYVGILPGYELSYVGYPHGSRWEYNKDEVPRVQGFVHQRS